MQNYADESEGPGGDINDDALAHLKEEVRLQQEINKVKGSPYPFGFCHSLSLSGILMSKLSYVSFDSLFPFEGASGEPTSGSVEERGGNPSCQAGRDRKSYVPSLCVSQWCCCWFRVITNEIPSKREFGISQSTWSFFNRESSGVLMYPCGDGGILE